MIPILSSRGTSAAGNVSALVVADAAEAPDREVSRRRNRKRKRARWKNPDTQRSTPWMDSLPMTEYESNEQRLHDEIVAFVEYVRPTRQETSVRELVLAKVEEVIRRCFSNCNITVFGSMAHELYLPEE
ncbi:hypothetical protein EW026_g1322 [Hermanssonia centrifuga]|uniref:Poly(A) RNA polymerase mitochondrial-like central palm domain-containing protein n=1 Tax=Hermanssonia centrifuga TaxID=98765 RepID=A0A4S4KS89_9APHY|nr:hypothetical protein EW026_g1322 [Hermanssonia centrifuga]